MRTCTVCRLHGQVTADVRGGAARRWDSFRVGDDTPGIVLAVGNRPRSNGWPYRRDGNSSEVGQYRADRSTLRYQDSSGAVWDTLRLTTAFQPRAPKATVSFIGLLGAHSASP